MRSYTELTSIHSYIERFRYLKIGGKIGQETFGFERYLNQKLYRSPEWKEIRRSVILRDNGCDLGIPGREIYGKIIVHHINPIRKDSLKNRNDLSYLFNMDYLISTSLLTHNAIHYGDENLLFNELTVRTPNDTCPWRK